MRTLGKQNCRSGCYQKWGSSHSLGFPWGSAGKESACECGRPEFDPWVGNIPWKGKGYPLQDSGLENSMDYIPMWLQTVRHNWATFIFSCSLPKRKENVQIGGKEKLLYFGCQQPRAGGPTPSPSHWQSVSKSFIGWGRGLQAKSTARSDIHLEIGHQCSDQHHLGCFKYNCSLVIVLVCFHFLRPILRIMAVFVMAIVWSSCKTFDW